MKKKFTPKSEAVWCSFWKLRSLPNKKHLVIIPLPHPRLIWESSSCYRDPNLPPESRFLWPNSTKPAKLIVLVTARSLYRKKKVTRYIKRDKTKAGKSDSVSWHVSRNNLTQIPIRFVEKKKKEKSQIVICTREFVLRNRHSKILVEN